ncbi:MAG TPA: iron-containing alcohol dehydrogenase [Acidimicrobiales bacterium]|nr:iron-containing alcohol dehydrogenase [Acidimicrobiales bacterium]
MFRTSSTPSRLGPLRRHRCKCGAIHHVPIDAAVIDESAIEQLGAYARARRWSRLLAVMDANTEEAVGWRVVRELSREKLGVRSFCFPERQGLLADKTNVSRLEEALDGADADSLVAVGSGVITDLTRYVTSRHGREFVSVPTAASMDGYASGIAAMEFGGMKTTVPAAPPAAIFADPVTVAAAPPDMARSGLGDLLGKATARVDWLSAHALYGEPLCAEVERRVTEPVVHAAAHVDAILERSPQAVAQLLRGLIESGVAMAMVGSSRPASGCEHHASHFWDLLASAGRRPHTPHGLQVGYATHFAMSLQGYAFGGGVAQLISPRPVADDHATSRLWFANHEAEVKAVLEEKRRYSTDHASSWPTTASQWQTIQAQVGGAMRLFPAITEALLAAKIPSEPGFLGLDGATIKTTFRLANRIRSRYTVLDFLEGQDRLDDAIDAALP